MSNDKKKKYVKITTPAGIARYPWLNKPETQVNGKTLDKPRFKVSLVLDEKDKGVKELRAELDKLHAEAIVVAEAARKKDPKRKNKPLTVNPVCKVVVDDEGNEVAGKFEITAKTNAEAKDGGQKKIAMFDAKGNATVAKVGGGSKLKLSITPDPYDSQMGAGLSLYLNAVQILELVEFGGGNASSYGFGEEEGYEGGGEPSDESDDSGNNDDETPEDAATGGDEAPAKRAKGDF